MSSKKRKKKSNVADQEQPTIEPLKPNENTWKMEIKNIEELASNVAEENAEEENKEKYVTIKITHSKREACVFNNVFAMKF